MPEHAHPAPRASARNLLAGAVLISFSGIYVKWAHTGPTTSAFYRVLIGGLILAALAGVRRERLWLDRSYLALQVVCGVICALDLFFWHRSILFVGPGLATILGNFQVILLPLVGVAFFAERPTFHLVAAIPLSLLGLLMIVGIRWRDLPSDFVWGVLFGLITAVCYTAYILILRRLQSDRRRLPPVANLSIVSLATAGVLAVIAVYHGDSFRIGDTSTLVVLCAYALFSQVCGWVLISRGLPGVRRSLAGLLLLLQPCLAFVWELLFFESATTPNQAIGILVTLGAIYLGGAVPETKSSPNDLNRRIP